MSNRIIQQCFSLVYTYHFQNQSNAQYRQRKLDLVSSTANIFFAGSGSIESSASGKSNKLILFFGRDDYRSNFKVLLTIKEILIIALTERKHPINFLNFRE